MNVPIADEKRDSSPSRSRLPLGDQNGVACMHGRGRSERRGEPARYGDTEKGGDRRRQVRRDEEVGFVSRSLLGRHVVRTCKAHDAGKDSGNLTPLAFNDNAGKRNRPSPSWLASQCQAYSVEVAGKVLRDGGGIASGSGDFTLAWAPTPPLIGKFIPLMSRQTHFQPCHS